METALPFVLIAVSVSVVILAAVGAMVIIDGIRDALQRRAIVRAMLPLREVEVTGKARSNVIEIRSQTMHPGSVARQRL